MAVPPPTNEAFLREVDDELRRDELLGLWRRWGRWLIGGIGLALAAFGGFLYWQHHRETAAGVEGEKLTEAYEAFGSGRTADATAQLALLTGSGHDGIRAMAVFTQADMQLARNDNAGAATIFATLANDTSLARPFRDLALIRQTAAEFDRLKPPVVVERLRPLAVVGGPWLGSAGELLAAAYLKEGRRDLAATLFGQIAQSDDVPPSLRQRAVQMAGLLSADAAAPVAGGNGEANTK